MFANLCVYESLCRLKINAFENWLTMKGKYEFFLRHCQSNGVSDLTREQNKENMVNVLQAHWNV